MAEKSFPWTGNATGDGTSGGYTALEWGEIWRRSFLGGQEATNGVAQGHGSELAVSGTASPLSVGIGAAYVYGKHYYNDSAKALTVATPTVGTTGGHVILRLDWATQTVRALAVRNTDGVAAIPALVQSTSTQWEVRLATFTITTGGVIALTDARGYLHFSTRVSTAMLDALSVTTPKIADANVTTPKIADASVTTPKMALDSVDDTIVGNRVPQMIARRGGDASNWHTPGTTNYTPGMVRMQAGAMTSNPTNGTTVTFPVPFSTIPLVTATVASPLLTPYIVMIGSVSTTSMSITLVNTSGVAVGSVNVNWLAIGTE